MNAEEIEQLAQTASLETSTTLNKLALLMQRPASVAEMLDPSLLLQAVDLGSLDRARVAIEKLEAAKIEHITNYVEARWGGGGDAMPVAQARELLSQAQALADRIHARVAQR